MEGSAEEYRSWRHRDLLDASGKKVGSVEDVYYDDATGSPQWLLVKTGLLGTHKTLVPAYDLGIREESVTAPYTGDRIKEAPKVDPDELLTEEQEKKLFSYYDLEYVASIEAVRWNPEAALTEEQVRQRLGRPTQCIRLDQTIMMQPAAQDDEET